MSDIALAQYLARNVPAIARHEQASQCLKDFRWMAERIERIINRKPPPLFLGPCPTLVGKRQECATQLRSDRNATEITCPTCRQIHQVDHLQQLLRNALRYHPMSAIEILGNRQSDLPGAVEQMGDKLPRTTFYTWVRGTAKDKTKRIAPHAYRTAGGATMPYRETDEDVPLYWLADVWRLMGIHQEDDDTP